MMAFLAALAALLLQSVTPRVQVQAGTAVRPETTTVGQHFVATIRVRVPVGYRVKFPARPDNGSQVDSAGPVARTDSTAGGFTESTANYVLAAWDTGAQRLGLDSVTVVTPTGDRLAALSGFQVYVRSVLPRDTALRKPKSFRPAIPVTPFNWLPWLIAAAIAMLAAILFVVWRNWRRRVAIGLTPLQLAERDFAGIESQRLLESGESERYAVEMVAVVRVYIASVVPAAAQSATTHELAAALLREQVIPLQRLVDVLDTTDLIKFARKRSTVERAREVGVEARRIVTEVAAMLDAASTARAKAA
jgi:hypothetical protein